jgi:phytoene dehydrogenase-like protein
VEAIPGVEIRYEHTVEDLIATADNSRITGVRVKGAGGEETLEADLVLDAAGRGTRAPRWLEALGFARPEEEKDVPAAIRSLQLWRKTAKR